MEPIIHVTVYSSLCFITNYLHALTQEYTIYALLFLGLTISSVLYHSFSNENNVTDTKPEPIKETIKTIDKTLCYLIIFYGAYMLARKLQKVYSGTETITQEKIILLIIIFSTFFATIFLFCSGNKYCFCENLNDAYCWHAFLHIISSIGHHWIIFL